MGIWIIINIYRHDFNFLGIRQGRKKDIDLNNLPFTKPTTKIIFGSSFILIGIIQLFPLMTS